MCVGQDIVWFGNKFRVFIELQPPGPGQICGRAEQLHSKAAAGSTFESSTQWVGQSGGGGRNEFGTSVFSHAVNKNGNETHLDSRRPGQAVTKRKGSEQKGKKFPNECAQLSTAFPPGDSARNCSENLAEVPDKGLC